LIGPAFALLAFLKRPETYTLVGGLGVFVAILYFSPDIVERSKTIREWVRGLGQIFQRGFGVLQSRFLTLLLAHASLGHGWFRQVSPMLAGQSDPAAAILCVLVAAVLFVLFFSAVASFLQVKSLRRDKAALGRELRAVAQDLAAVKSERDRVSGALTQLKSESATLLAERAAVTERLEQAAAERDLLRGASIQLEEERKRLQTAFEAREGKLKQLVDGTIKATSKVRSQLFPPPKGAGKTFEEVHLTYHIARNFDADVRRRFVLRAGAEPLHFWQTGIRASDDAEAADMFVDINYRVTNKTPETDVAYLPTRNEPRAKSACIFFLPRVEPGDCRGIEVSFHWKAMFAKLFREGWEDCSELLRNAETLRHYSLEVYLEPGTGGALACMETGVRLPGKRLEQVTSHRGWPGWKYSAQNIPAELLQNEIVLQCRWRKS
jgi:hypothetical protein